MAGSSIDKVNGTPPRPARHPLMSERIVWNPARVPAEVESGVERVVFVRRRRLPAFLLGCLSAALAIACWKLTWGTSHELAGVLFLPFWGVVALLFLVEAMISVWSQQGLVVDLARREIALVGRRPRTISRMVYPFSVLRTITVARPEGPASLVVLTVEGGASLLLARDFDEPATAFARRIAELIGIPLGP
jgi:hypothetical protein